MQLILLVGFMLLSPRSYSFILKPRSKQCYTRYFSSIEETPWKPNFSKYKSSFPDLTSSQWNELDILALKLYEWNSKINLISRQDIGNLVENHILPSLSIVKVRKFQNQERVIDVGTGGGLPGLPLAIACPDAKFTLLDSNTKKMMVVQDLVNVLNLQHRVRVLSCRAETHSEHYDFILGRAVSALPNFLSFSSHFIAPSPTPSPSSLLQPGLLYLKGGDFTQELLQAQVSTSTLHPVQGLLDDRVETDKQVLYIPAGQIAEFWGRMKDGGVGAGGSGGMAGTKGGMGGRGGSPSKRGGGSGGRSIGSTDRAHKGVVKVNRQSAS